VAAIAELYTLSVLALHHLEIQNTPHCESGAKIWRCSGERVTNWFLIITHVALELTNAEMRARFAESVREFLYFVFARLCFLALSRFSPNEH
jgi:hypothetical protein